MTAAPERNIVRDELGFRVENFDEYRAKKHYTIPFDEEKLAEELGKFEEDLKKYPYYQDQSRLSGVIFHDYRAIERFEQNVFYGIINGAIVGTTWAKLFYGAYNTKERARKSRFFFGVGGFLVASYFPPSLLTRAGLYHYLSPFWQPQNRGLLAFLTLEQRYKNALELKYDLYKNVDLNKTVDFEKSAWEVKREIMRYNGMVIEKRKKVAIEAIAQRRGEK